MEEKMKEVVTHTLRGNGKEDKQQTLTRNDRRRREKKTSGKRERERERERERILTCERFL